MAISQFNLDNGQRAERKLLITVAEWDESGTPVREVLGTRTEDSSIEYNADISTTTDILGNNYTDINRTQPQQDFDPYLVLGGCTLSQLSLALPVRMKPRNTMIAQSRIILSVAIPMSTSRFLCISVIRLPTER